MHGLAELKSFCQAETTESQPYKRSRNLAAIRAWAGSAHELLRLGAGDGRSVCFLVQISRRHLHGQQHTTNGLCRTHAALTSFIKIWRVHFRCYVRSPVYEISRVTTNVLPVVVRLAGVDHHEDDESNVSFTTSSTSSWHHIATLTKMLSWGTSTCHFRRRRRPITQEWLQLPSIILIGPFPNSIWILCRHLESTTISTACSAGAPSSDILLCYDFSICVTGSSVDSLVEPIYLAAAVNSGDHGFMGSSAGRHSHLRLSPLQERGIESPTFIARPKSDPTVALSAVFTVGAHPPFDAEDSGDRSLLLSALKRQIVGTPIVFTQDHHGALTPTTMSLVFDQHEWRYTVKSVLSESHSRRDQPSFFWILPSTRITLEWDTSVYKRVSTTGPMTFYNEEATSSNGVTALSSTAKQLVSVIQCLFKRRRANLSRSFVLTGPPGVGKTHAVRSTVNYIQDVDSMIRLHLLSLRGSEIMSVGQASEAADVLDRHFQRAAHLSEGSSNDVALVFVDECEALMTDSIMAAMLAYLLDQVTSNWPRVIFVGATNRVDDVPYFLRRPGRLDKEISLAPPNPQERMAILSSLLQKAFDGDVTVSEHELRDIAERCVGFVPADLDLLVRYAVVGTGNHCSLPELLAEGISTVGASALREASLSAPPKASWGDIAGDPGGAKTALRQAIEWPRTKRVAFDRLGLSAPRGILLYGPPGCAKSSLARAAAAEASVAFLSFSPADVYASSYIGDAEAIIRRGFALARSAAPCILFFDELDSVVGFEKDPLESGLQGVQRGRSAEARVLSTFLNEMDGVDGSWNDGVLVLGATNRPRTLDAALLRPGRFDMILYVPPPDRQCRRSILEMQCKHWRTDEPFDFDYLARDEITGSMTGAEIVGACRESASRAMYRTLSKTNYPSVPIIRQDELERALQDVKPLLANKDMMDEFSMLEEHRDGS